MNEVERYKKLEAERDTLQSKLGGIPADLNAYRAELQPLQDAAVRAEIEGDKNAPNRRAEIDRVKQKISELEAEQKELTHKVKIMNEVLHEYQSKAVVELVSIHEPLFRKAVKRLAEAIYATVAVEDEMVKVRDQAQAAFGNIGAQCPLPSWRAQFRSDIYNPGMSPALRSFLDAWTQQGFDVSGK